MDTLPMGEYKAGQDAALDPSLRLVAHGSGLGRRPAPAGGKQQGLVPRQMRTGWAVEGGSPARAAESRRQGRPWREAHWTEQQEQLQSLVGPTHRLSLASSAAARTAEKGSCAIVGGEFTTHNKISHFFGFQPGFGIILLILCSRTSSTMKHRKGRE